MKLVKNLHLSIYLSIYLLIIFQSKVVAQNPTCNMVTNGYQVVFERANISGYKSTLYISQLASGLYFVEVQQADAVYRTKLVKE